MGIYSIKKVAAAKTKGREKNAGVGLRSSYLRVVGIQVDTEGAGNDEHNTSVDRSRVLHLRQNTTMFRSKLQGCVWFIFN